jgi:signal transduction histidine kinase
MALALERERLLQERAEAHANELALMEANRRTDEFLSIASHELRTPLTTINGNIQLAKRRMRTLSRNDSQEEFDDRLALVMELLGRAERQVRVQNRLVSDLLDVSRIQANRLELRSDVCDLAAIVSECVEDQRAAHPTRALSLTLPAHEIPILADADRISQVVTNYLTNALKYSAAAMPVDVSLSEADGFVRVSVRDQGPGLLPEEHQLVWQRFYRVPGISVRSGSGVGLGLGLYICRTIVERHHGQVGVQSTQGQGSVFWFTLPITTHL